MHSILKRALSGAAAIGLGVALVPLLGGGVASAAPGPQADPVLTPSATPSGQFSFNVPGGVFCDGTGGQGWRLHTFIVEDGVDLSTLDFGAGPLPGYIGFDVDASDGTVAAPLHAGESAVVNVLPAGTPAGLIDPANLEGFTFDAGVGWNLVDGVYQVGFACVDGPGNLQQWWANTVTLDVDASPNPFMVEGTAPAAPTIDSVVPDTGECTVHFTPDPANPGTSYRADADDGATVTSETGPASPITITGLSNGTTYDITVFAVSAAGEAASANTLPCVPETNGGAVQNLAVVDQGTDDGAGATYLDADWDAPAAVAGCTVTGYAVTSPAVPPAVVTQPSPAGDATSARITDVPTNVTVNVTVTPSFAPGCVGTPATVQGFVATGNVIIQDIDVTRPIGALVLTQVCGTNGTLPAEGQDAAAATFGDADGTSDFPGTLDGQDLQSSPLGFDRAGALPEIAANQPSAVGAPSLPASGQPTLLADPASAGDPGYAAYPYPTTNGIASPAAETHCGVDLGVAEYVTSGSGAGQYFAAQGVMSQVTLVDTRNVDAGWSVTGQVSDFVAAVLDDDGSGLDGVDSFSGDFLGWTPVVSEDTSGFDNDLDPGTPDYDQAVVAGALVAPASIGGLGDGETLASAAAGSGHGSAIMDARLKLLIPVTADAGLYEAALRFSAV